MKNKLFTALTIVILTVLSLPSGASAQEKVLFGGSLQSGGYGGPSLSFGQINDEIGLFVGGKGAWVINHTFAIGIGGEGLVSNHKVKGYSQEVVSFLNYPETTYIDSSWYLSDFGYGGVYLEYIYNSNELVHLTGTILIGGGHLAYNPEPISMNQNHYPHYDSEYLSYDRKSSNFFVIEPALNAEINVAKWFRFDAGLGYRLVSSVDMPNTTSEQLSGLYGKITFKFGKF
ncbi:MAG: hypothetical protein A2X64_03180 [Ignavibacteria bacterium GWF2_33_9]|nr:MAG: hypothetical protein A2X64_03180 [Ignavibacteria bacterium GWF2_33_9]